MNYLLILLAVSITIFILLIIKGNQIEKNKIKKHHLYDNRDLKNMSLIQVSDYLNYLKEQDLKLKNDLNLKLKNDLNLKEIKDKIIKNLGNEKANIIFSDEVPLGINLNEFNFYIEYLKILKPENRNLNFQKPIITKNKNKTKTKIRNWIRSTKVKDRREYVFINDILEEIKIF
jgi:hypothetical protein